MLARSAVALSRRVLVIGGGMMGSGIAQVSAAAGHHVTLVDQSEGALAKGLKGVEFSLGKLAKKKFADAPEDGAAWVGDVLGRIATATDVAQGAGEADIVVEAIAENMEVKKAVWGRVDAVASTDAIFASNTSSLSIAEMAQAARNPARFAGLHFFSPVPMMKLVEVVRTEATEQRVLDDLTAYSKEIGKVPIQCKDTKGFVVNRLLVPYLMEAVRMVERGDATAADVDTAMKLGAGYPMGPFELADATGNDIIHSIIQGWHADEPGLTQFNPSPLLNKMVEEEGKLGRKTGEGFYNYKK
eukprot:TRINITY_DN947_c0_g4_i1.p3 TRINITY_DN947_c0_g4~~TRINITY_DN947_c0_g4_i1.p3  ORF type:complete len:300 (+),score=145.72 TRINITY_DN947_c0_g4_i1:62-961(+)